MQLQNAARMILRTITIAVAVFVGAFSQAHAATIFASNFANNTITAYDFATGNFLFTPVTGGPEGDGFNGIRIGSFLVAGQRTNNILKYSAAGALLSVFDPGNTAGLKSPQGITFGPDGKLYVVSSANDMIIKYDPVTGQSLGAFANLGAGGPIGPIDLAFGPDGNLYVSSFDNDQIVKINGQTGAVLSRKQGPAGNGFGAAAFGPNGNFYIEAVDLTTLAGTVYRYNIMTGDLTLFIAQGSGGLQSPGGLAFGPDGNLLLTNLIVDENFADVGSTILKFNGQTGAPIGTLVGAGQGLNVPFFITVAADPGPGIAVPEPSGMALFGLGGVVFLCLWARRSGWRIERVRY